MAATGEKPMAVDRLPRALSELIVRKSRWYSGRTTMAGR
jgi:hypothetical protein